MLTDGAPYYRASCRILNLRHGLYSIEVRNLMERIVKLRIDSYSITTCINDGCDEEHAKMLLNNNDNDERMDK